MLPLTRVGLSCESHSIGRGVLELGRRSDHRRYSVVQRARAFWEFLAAPNAEKGGTTLRPLAAIVALLVIMQATACGGGEGEPSPSATAIPPSESPTPTSTALSPEAAPVDAIPIGKIAFVSRRDGDSEIYVTKAVGGETNLTNNPAEDIDPDWSPDGNKLVFSSDRDGNYEIYVANADDSGVRRLTKAPTADLSPRWSPDGTRIAYSRQGTIVVMGSDGSSPRPITEPEAEATAPPCQGPALLGGWSPDGERLTFHSASGSRGIAQVCTINVDGSDLRVVVSEPPTYHEEPSWSPDGQHIVYRSIREGNHDIYVVKPDGSSEIRLTDSTAIDMEPDWSPNGQWIAFSSDRQGTFEMFIMRADGSELLQITNSRAKDSSPSWGRE